MGTSNSMVAHRWAHQQTSKGLKGSNLRADGPWLISYGTTIGYHAGEVVFLSADRMSPTTGRHLLEAWRACRHLHIVYTPVFRYGRRLHYETALDVRAALAAAEHACNAEIAEVNKARMSKHLHYRFDRVLDVRATLRRACMLLDVSTGVADVDIDDARHQLAQEYSALADQRAQVAAIARAASARKASAAQFRQWLRGESVQCPYSFYRVAGTMFLTLRGDTVHTSGGAQAPLEHVRRGLAVWKRCMAHGTTYQHTEHTVPLGHFRLDSIDDRGNVRAGCHTFSRAVVTAFVQRFGL